MMTVSVVIATYNRGARIGRTLDSLLRQTRPPEEIIVSDDGSTDDTATWIRHRYSDVRVVTHSNGGTSVARNRGAAVARGDILVFIDHDDEMLPHGIETLTELLALFSEAKAAYTDHRLCDSTTGAITPNHHTAIASFEKLRRTRFVEETPRGRLYGRSLYYTLLRGNMLQQPWATYRDTFNSTGGFDPNIRYCEDWELYMRVVAKYPVAVSNEVISNHFIEGNNLHQADGQEEQQMKVIRKHLRQTRWRDPRAHVVLRRRLAMYYKCAGDIAGSRDAAKRHYWSSLVTWPFDAVVAARCMLWGAGYE